MTNTLKRHHMRAPFDRFGGLTGEARRQEKIRQHALLYGAGPRFMQKEYGLGFLITHQMLEDDMYGKQYVPLSLRVLDAGDKLFMKEMGWTEPQYRLWLREIERMDEREQDEKVEYAQINMQETERKYTDELSRTPLRKDQLNNMIDSLVPNKPIAPPPKQEPHIMIALGHFAIQRSIVTAARDRLRDYIKTARDTSPNDPAHDELVDMVSNAVNQLLHSTHKLLRMAETISEGVGSNGR